MSRGRGAHYVPRVKDRDKREVAFSLVPSNLGKKGKVCSYSARLTHNQVLDEDAVISEMCEEFNLPKNRVVQNLQQISDYLVSRIKKGYQVTFGGFTVGLSISGKFDAMNAEFDPEKNMEGFDSLDMRLLEDQAKDPLHVDERSPWSFGGLNPFVKDPDYQRPKGHIERKTKK